MPYRRRRVGMGKRGMHHATAFPPTNDSKLAGVATAIKAADAAAQSSASVEEQSRCDAACAKEVKPDVFCFCTPPDVRLPLDQDRGSQSGAKLIAFEKPVAMTSAEGLADQGRAGSSRRQSGGQPPASIRRALQKGEGDHRQRRDRRRSHGLRHRDRLGAHMFSHLVEYTSWFNNYEPAEWVMGQAAGRGKLSDSHASPDYIAGVVHFRNGVRGVYDCGAGAPDVPEVPYWWRKCRIGAKGTEGFAEVHTGGGWRAVTKNGVADRDPAAWITTTTWRPTSSKWPIGSTTSASRTRCDSRERIADWRSCPASIGR